MIFGLSTPTFTLLHVIISLVGIFTGVVAVLGMLNAQRLPGWTAVFLVTTILTSVTGFMFPVDGIDPARALGIISLVVLALSVVALYVYDLRGAWRWIYVVSAVIALYLNTFVGVVQSFQKVAFLHPLAPTGSEPPFKIAQGLLLVLFIVLGVLAAKKFHPPSRMSA